MLVETGLKQLRIEKGISQAKLAKFLCVPQYALSEWELGKKAPPPDVEERILRVLDEIEDHIRSGRLIVSKRRWSLFSKRAESGECASLPGSGLEARRLQTGTSAVGGWLELSPSRLPVFASSGRRYTGVSLFSGCGGMALGFAHAGVECLGFVELNDAARTTYKANFPHTRSLGTDVRLLTENNLGSLPIESGELDVLFGGPPCQGFSLAGKRDHHDERNELYGEFARVARFLKPKVVVLENVRLLTSMKSKSNTRVLEEILETFRAVGYRMNYKELNAQEYGVPQFRERVFFVGVRRDLSVSEAGFPPVTHGAARQGALFPDELKPFVTFRDASSDLEALEAGENSTTDPLHWAVPHPRHVIEWLRDVPEGQSAHDNPDRERRPPSGYNTTYKRIKWDEPCSTIGTTFGMISGSRNVHPVYTRSFTIREAMRCQSFPDDFVFRGSIGEIRTMIGNAVPPLLAKAIAQHLIQNVLDRLG